ncbi:MAG: bifunctional aldolase/short-chain dehydrogenase [Acidobacteria bacterium]|nr:bifunctional aldolase/short-chain dehydrogenase [Acidobacteriota bacterium]
MKPWNQVEAQKAIETYAAWGQDLALRVYASRLLGSQADLVLHGGGNTSVKTSARDILGRPIDVLAVKGSGWNLATIEPQGFPQLRMHGLQELRQLHTLNDEDMVSSLRGLMLDSRAPNPSVETLLHAFIPQKFIDHAHADAILAIANQADAARRFQDLFGDRFGIVPYIMPGFALSLAAAQTYEQNPNVEGLMLLNHGIFTFAETAEESYQRMSDAVTKARSSLNKTVFASTTTPPSSHRVRQAIVTLRGVLNTHSNQHWVIHQRNNERMQEIRQLENWKHVLQLGPMTPDHVIRTKQKPLILDLDAEDPKQHIEDAVAAYVTSYQSYFQTQINRTSRKVTPLDPYPRVVAIPDVGILGIGSQLSQARAAADLFEHTLSTTIDAQGIGSYAPLNDNHIFDMEYWSLEQAKLGKSKPHALQGQVALVTGAGGGIGAAIVHKLVASGCCVIAADQDVARLNRLSSVVTVQGDVCDPSWARIAVDLAIDHFGGLDLVVSNAGAAFTGRIDISEPELRRSMDLNFWSHYHLAAAAAETMIQQSSGGCLLFNASKSAFNPGPDFGPYAVAKASLVALTKQLAVDLASFGIRANAINADRIRTHLFDPGLLEARARARGLDVDSYFRSNLLGREVTAEDVADMFIAAYCAEKTTGSVFQVDGGNMAASPR